MDVLTHPDFLADYERLAGVTLDPARHRAPHARAHCEQVAARAEALARAHGCSPKERVLLVTLAKVHDIGKLEGHARPAASVERLQGYGVDDPTLLALVKVHDTNLPWWQSWRRGEAPSDRAWARLARRANLRLLALFMIADRVDAPGGWRANAPLMWFLGEASRRGLLDLDLDAIDSDAVPEPGPRSDSNPDSDPDSNPDSNPGPGPGPALASPGEAAGAAGAAGAPPRIVSLSLGLSHTCAAAEDGRATCWGIDVQGRLGRGTEGQNIGDNEAPADVAPLPLDGVVRIVTAPNARHVCALHHEGRLRCWGNGVHGALGRGSASSYGDQADESLDALPVLSLPGEVVDVSLSTARTCAIVRQDGRRALYCWGRGEHGALGLGSTEDVGDDEPPTARGPVPLTVEVVEVATGNDHTCARLVDGTLRCWGEGARGQLGVVGGSADLGDGLGDGRGRGRWPDDPALRVEGLDGVEVVEVDAAGDRTCVLTAQGGVRCWGSNDGAALGYRWSELPGCRAGDEPSTCDLEAPLPFDVDLGDLHGATLVGLSTGQRHTCVVDDRGGVRCWGENFSGQLGDGQSEDVGHWRAPAEAWHGLELGGVLDVGDADGDGRVDPVARIVAGMLHTCALMVDGSVRCWGSGGEGRLGYASTDHVGLGVSPGSDYAHHGIYGVRVFDRAR
ncbi:MAG: hypothetical protein KDK70_19090 [Myxococcales bacterium]|nr:hypothetical protein [Myxococcales bacterium]